jgi:hypothetical protein
MVYVDVMVVHDPLVLASEVTSGLLAGAEPNTHQFYFTICLMG